MQNLYTYMYITSALVYTFDRSKDRARTSPSEHNM